MNMRLKVSGFAVLLFALAGCASQSDKTAAPSPSPSPSATATPSVSTSALISPVVLPDCLSSQLSIIDGRHGVAMGSVGVDGIAFKNVSKTSCTLRGYPDLQMLDAAAKPITTHLHKGTSYTVQTTPEDMVTLLPGGEALFDLGYSSSTGYGTLKCPTATQEEITPPGSDQPIIVNWQMDPYGGSIPKLHCGEVTVSSVYAPPAH